MDQNQADTTQLSSPPKSPVSTQISSKIKLAGLGVILILLVGIGAFLLGRKTVNNSPVLITPTISPDQESLNQKVYLFKKPWLPQSEQRLYITLPPGSEISFPNDHSVDMTIDNKSYIMRNNFSQEASFGGVTKDNSVSGFNFLKDADGNVVAIWPNDRELGLLFSGVGRNEHHFAILKNPEMDFSTSEVEIWKEILRTVKIENPGQQSNDWKTYKTDKLSFSYPSQYIVKENTKGFYSISSDDDNFSMTVDTRLIEPNADYDSSLANAKSLFSQPITKTIKGGIEVSGKFGPGPLEGETGLIAILGYKQGAIAADVGINPDSKKIALFDRIISTFSFLE